MHVVSLLHYKQSSYWPKKAKSVDLYRVHFISSVNFLSYFGHPKVNETSVWTPCFQILAKTMGRPVVKRRLFFVRAVPYLMGGRQSQVELQGNQWFYPKVLRCPWTLAEIVTYRERFYSFSPMRESGDWSPQLLFVLDDLDWLTVDGTCDCSQS